MGYVANAFFAGLFLFIAGVFGLMRHFLLEPGIQNYPKAPSWLLKVYFLFATVLIYMGLTYFTVWFMGGPNTIPPGASPKMVLLSFAILFYKGSMFVNVLRQRYPPEVWARINRLQDIVKCSRPSR